MLVCPAGWSRYAAWCAADPREDDDRAIDQVVEDLATANAVVASFDTVTVAEWERELTSIVTPQEGHFKKMAGWVANQTRFPKARNEA